MHECKHASKHAIHELALPLELEKTPSRVLKHSCMQACEKASSLAQVVEQWTGNPKAAGSIPVGRQFFALLVLSSRRSGGSSLGFRAGSL